MVRQNSAPGETKPRRNAIGPDIPPGETYMVGPTRPRFPRKTRGKQSPSRSPHDHRPRDDCRLFEKTPVAPIGPGAREPPEERPNLVPRVPPKRTGRPAIPASPFARRPPPAGTTAPSPRPEPVFWAGPAHPHKKPSGLTKGPPPRKHHRQLHPAPPFPPAREDPTESPAAERPTRKKCPGPRQKKKKHRPNHPPRPAQEKTPPPRTKKPHAFEKPRNFRCSHRMCAWPPFWGWAARVPRAPRPTEPGVPESPAFPPTLSAAVTKIRSGPVLGDKIAPNDGPKASASRRPRLPQPEFGPKSPPPLGRTYPRVPEHFPGRYLLPPGRRINKQRYLCPAAPPPVRKNPSRWLTIRSTILWLENMPRRCFVPPQGPIRTVRSPRTQRPQVLAPSGPRPPPPPTWVIEGAENRNPGAIPARVFAKSAPPQSMIFAGTRMPGGRTKKISDAGANPSKPTGKTGPPGRPIVKPRSSVSALNDPNDERARPLEGN